MKTSTLNFNPALLALLAGFSLSPFSICAQQYTPGNPPPAFPPNNVTFTQDRDQMCYQLGVRFSSLPPKLQDPNKPLNSYPSTPTDPEGNWTDALGHTITRSGWGLWNNYDDRTNTFFPGPQDWRVGDYSPIDLLKMHDGTVITTAADWWTKRRPELLKDAQEQIWGVIPSNDILPSVTWTVSTNTFSGTGAAAFRQVTITGTIDTSRYPGVRNVPRITAILRTPRNASGPVPVIILHGNAVGTYFQYVQNAGWGVCQFNDTTLQPDNGVGLTSYLIGLVNQGNWRKPTDWGSLGAWSWGVSKLIDFFETYQGTNELSGTANPFQIVDPTKVGVEGHSRYGKATLVSMAYESRLWVAFPSCGGSLGTKMNRRHWGQDVEDSSWDQEYHWMAGNFLNWGGPLVPGQYLPRKIENCPVDAHSLLSLCAPRPVFLNGGDDDTWTDPYGIYLTGAGATPVYQLLGKRGLVMPAPKPALNAPYIQGEIAFRYHDGGHTDTLDWPSFVSFANRFLNVPSCSLSGNIAAKSGAQNNRLWTIAVNNDGPGKAYAARITGLTLTQTAGPACTPVITSTFPILIGDVANDTSADGVVAIDFTGCPATARFTATASFSANGGLRGATTGSMLRNNQYR